MNAATPFLTYLERARQRIESAPDAHQLLLNWRHDDGVLEGFFLAGAVSAVEFRAARTDLLLAYEARKGMFDIDAEWNRRHGDPA